MCTYTSFGGALKVVASDDIQSSALWSARAAVTADHDRDDKDTIAVGGVENSGAAARVSRSYARIVLSPM